MIIIYINELKNISMSLFKINYIKDVADINIKKHCNDIYCEAETARFKLADNSYSLISPNDIFNTKSYYFMIMIIVVLIYVNLFYNFIEYNNIYYKLINNIDGDIVINIIRFLPYLLAIIIFAFIIVIIIARYVPYDKQGYINYFNYNNSYIDVINNFNIDKIHIYTWTTILSVGGLYILLSILFAEILQYPDEDYTRGKKYKYLCVGYITIICIFTYLILNLMNILLSFSENNYPKLDDNIMDTILNNLDNKIKELSGKYNIHDVIKKCYKEIDGITWDDNAPLRLKINNVEIKTDGNKLYNINDIYDKYANKEDNIGNLITKDNYKKLKENKVFPLNTIEYTKYHTLISDETVSKTINKYDPTEILNYLSISDLKSELTKYIDNIRIKELCYDPSYKKIEGCKEDRNTSRILLTILILISMNEIKKFKKYIKDIPDLKSIPNKQKNNYYNAHLKLLEFVNYINTLIIEPRTLDPEQINNLERKINQYIILFDIYIKLLDGEGEIKDSMFFGAEYDPFSTTNEAKENYSADFSYNSENTFYEKYFNVLENFKSKGYYDLEYNVGSYYIKNIKTLIYFILIIFATGILCIILFYIPNVELIYKYTWEIILPIVLLLIFVLYIAIFMNFNTNYNSNVIYGVLNSSYKRDLNDLNNMLIPVIKKSTSDKAYNKLEKGNYLELYIISNVFMSLIYYRDSVIGDYTETLKGIADEEKDNRINYDEKLDNVNFEKDYNDLGKIIYDKLYDSNNNLRTNADNDLYTFLSTYASFGTDSAKRNADNFLKSDGTAIHLKKYITEFIKHPSGENYKYDQAELTTKYKQNDLRRFLIIVIKNLIKYFKRYDIKKKIINDMDNQNFFKENVFFCKKNNKVLWNKFIIKKSFFDYYANPKFLSGKYKNIFKEDLYEDELINVDNYVDQYLKILSHYYFNCVIKKTTDSTIKESIRTALLSKESSYATNLDTYIDNTRNNKLIKLLLFIKPTNTSDLITNIDMDDTFKIKSTSPGDEENVIINSTITLFNNNNIYTNLKPFNLSNIYQYMIKNSLRKNQDDTTNYLMNIVKTIYYQINNEKIQYHNDYLVPATSATPTIPGSIITQFETDSEVKIYENASYTISYELFNTYFLNLIIIIFIYNIALQKNKNISIH
jgi:hypothetical protein